MGAVPIVAFDKTKTKHALTGVSVREVFLISLYDQDVNRLLSEKVGSNPTPLQPVIKQWTWQYEYAMNVTATGYTPDPLKSVTSRAILVPKPRQDIPLAGNVANANPPWFKFDDPSWARYFD
ncbi:hypothetical protein OEA41_002616 [Lepraria neglecta]|uniref:Uncharacterized protein n=1 Tax=Lepraria neglecta TaxID=209136 RepID=A0AAD9ZBW3_9LECA|nr:hypothetical protein OEA41_002616 [Lepraria neglecta]